LDEVEQNIVICQVTGQRLRQIIDLRDTDKSRYFAITEFNNCFIIRLPIFFLMNIFGKGQERQTEIKWLPSHFAYLCGQTQLDDIAHEQTIICSLKTVICRSRGELSANEKEEKFASNNKVGYIGGGSFTI